MSNTLTPAQTNWNSIYTAYESKRSALLSQIDRYPNEQTRENQTIRRDILIVEYMINQHIEFGRSNATQNETLSATNTLADIDGLGSIGTQWQSSTDGTTWRAIADATSSNFTLTEAQVGKQVRAVASYIDGHGTHERISSVATTPVLNVNDDPTGDVSITGTATQNQELSADISTLNDIDGLGFLRYQWQASDNEISWNDIADATASRFTLTEAQVGRHVRAVVSYVDGHGKAESVASGTTETVAHLNALLTGDSGDNLLCGGAGNDTLDGGAGTDLLVGGAGNDTYRFGLGNGADTVQENDATPGKLDTIEFLAGIDAEQIWLHQAGNDLTLSVIGTSDTLTIQNWYEGSEHRIEQFRTADGKQLLEGQVEQLVQAMATFAPPEAGQTVLPTPCRDSLAPVIAANWH